jgi:putative MATE family efflux protein
LVLKEEKMTIQKTKFFDKYIVKDRAFYKKTLLILIPVVLQSCINQGVNMMDTIMVGQLGEVAISASSLANQFYSIFNFLCMGISAAGLVLASQYYGGKDIPTVHRVFDLVTQIVAISGAFFAVITFLVPEQIMSIYIDDPEVIRVGAGYLRVTALVYLPHGISLVITNVIRAAGNAKLGLYVSIASFIINIGANYTFIFGKLGFAPMGVTGAAWGTLCARVVEFAVCAVYLFQIDKKLRYRPSGLVKAPTRALLGEFRRLGMPAVISDTILALAASMISIILGHMGTEIVSAYAIVTVVDRMCTVAIMGIASAASVVIGQTVGEGAFERAQKEGTTFLTLSAGVGLIASILVLLLGEWSISLYDIEASTVAITTSMMQASAIIVFFQAIQSAMGKGILRGGGDTRFLMLADILFQWCASIPLGYLVGIVLKWPPFIVLIALRIDYIIKAFWLISRLLSGKWIHKAKSMGGA